MAIFEGDEESSEARAEDERAAREDEGDETERSPDERVADGPAAAHEGRQSARRLFAVANPDAFSLCTLPRDHDLAGFSAGKFSLDTRSVGGGALPDSHPAAPDDGNDGDLANGDAGAVHRSVAEENDGHRYADLYALLFVERAVGFSFVLARW